MSLKLFGVFIIIRFLIYSFFFSFYPAFLYIVDIDFYYYREELGLESLSPERENIWCT